jgi:predicted RNase H-like HicB family nuclease
VIFEPAEEGGYCVYVPALNGLATQGETLEEAREMAKEAIIGYLEALAKDGRPAPVEETREISEPAGEIVEVSVA